MYKGPYEEKFEQQYEEEQRGCTLIDDDNIEVLSL